MVISKGMRQHPEAELRQVQEEAVWIANAGDGVDFLAGKGARGAALAGIPSCGAAPRLRAAWNSP